MSPFKAGSVVCPMCSAENVQGRTRCFLCGQSLRGATRLAPPKPSPDPAAGRPTFGLTSMMLVISLVAVFLGVFQESPRLAMMLAVPGTIALIRTLAVAGHRAGPTSWFDHVAVFVFTFAAVVAVTIAAGIAFFTTCLAIVLTGPDPRGDRGFRAGLIGGQIVGVAVIIGLTWACLAWSRRARSR